jgi:hypothetical protein
MRGPPPVVLPLALAGLVLGAALPRAGADEGFWTPDGFPRKLVKDRYGVELSDALLHRAARAAIRFSSDGGSGALVSPHGLIAIKHGYSKGCLHAVREARRAAGRFARFCQDQAVRKAIPLFDRLYCRPLDRAGDYDFIERGYLARTQEEELRCPGLEVTRLVEVSDVTAAMRAAMAALPDGASPADRTRAEQKAQQRLEAACQRRPEDSCQVATLFGGSRYQLYRSHRYSDVRLVFATERHMADFGDLQDHMTFPDHDFKTAFMRAYEGGRPARTPQHLPFSIRRLREGELTMMVAHPGTPRGFLPSALERSRDSAAAQLSRMFELRGILSQLASQRPSLAPGFDFDDKNATILSMLNHLGELTPDLIQARAREQRQLLDELERRKDPGLPEIRQALAAAAQAHAAYVGDRERLLALGGLNLSGLCSMAFRVLSMLERPDSLSARQGLLVPDILDQKVETARFELMLRKLQETFPSGDPLLRKALGDVSSHERATALAQGTRLGDPAFRRDLVAGGKAAVDRARDPVIELMKSIEPELDALSKVWSTAWERDNHAADLLDAARYRLHGDDVYPNGTGTVRLSFGTLKSYRQGARTIAPVTTLADLFGMARSHGPYQLPADWLAARSSLDLSAPLNVASTNDMSDAAVLLDDRGDLVGVNFNSNRQGTHVVYTEAQSRLVAVHNAAVVQILRHVYRADRLLAELGFSR